MYEDLEKLFLLYYKELYFYIIKLGANEEIADDIIQNTFLEGIKSIEGFKNKSSLKTWLFSIAKYQLYRYFRKNKINVNIDDICESNFKEDLDYTDKVLSDHMLETINNLSPPINKIMKMRIIDGLSFKEIGLQVGKTENYCRVSFYRIKEKLREEYKYE